MSSKSGTQAKVVDLEGNEMGSVNLPSVFRVPIRKDLIWRTFVALDSHRRRSQGRDPLAGERTTAETYNPPTGRGVSRIPRVKGERYSKSGMGGGVASVVHGRLPFPPRSEKVVRKEINSKESRLALACAIASTGDEKLVSQRGHAFKGDLPIVASDELESLAKVRDLKRFMKAIGLEQELFRISKRTRKSNPNLSRLRRTGVGPLVVVSKKQSLKRALKSFSGVSVVESPELSVLDLAPGSSPGRLTIWTKSAISMIPKQVLAVGERYAS
jgi:large subunit ribosomal protein L4e